jgi:alpha-beta hydrolase superfamily lysophospholipase
LAPYAAKIIPTFTIDGDIRLHDISRLPEVLETIENDEFIHRKISFGTGHVILGMCEELESRGEPEIKIPSLFIHGTADKITE